MSRVKQIQESEEGYVVVKMSSAKDIDLYMLELMQNVPGTLTCMQKKRMKTTFLYDTKGRMSIVEVFSLWLFDGEAAIDFLLAVFDVLKNVEERLPLYAAANAVYVREDLHDARVIVLPVYEHVNKENDWNTFFKEILEHIQIHDGYEVMGYLYMMSRQTLQSAAAIHTALSAYPRREQGIVKPWLRYRKKQEQQHLAEENMSRMRKAMDVRRLHQSTLGEEESEAVQESKEHTVMLSPTQPQAYLQGEYQQFPISKETWIGRSSICQVVLEHPTISSKHACIEKRGEGYVLYDASSSNGTYINNEKLKADQRILLQHQDEIAFADIKMIFYYPQEL